jgi:hypothetical protein
MPADFDIDAVLRLLNATYRDLEIIILASTAMQPSS